MNKSTFLLVLTILIGTVSFSQTEQKDETKNTLNNQFELFYRKSSNYQEYKVVKKAWLLDYEKNVTDSLKVSKQNLLKATIAQNSAQKKADSLKTSLENLQISYKKLTDEKQQLSFLGISMFKDNFRMLTYLIILILILLAGLFFYKFKESNTITNAATQNLSELEDEFAEYKKRAIEREQQVRRQLQDELNKQKKK